MPLIADCVQLIKGLTQLEEYTEKKLEMVGDSYAAEMEEFAKKHAPWTDRTGNARRTMEGFCEKDGDAFKIGIMGKMPYSPTLELEYDQKYAILYPTLERYVTRILAGIEGVI